MRLKVADGNFCIAPTMQLLGYSAAIHDDITKR